jgi:predicted RecB family nuclease
LYGGHSSILNKQCSEFRAFVEQGAPHRAERPTLQRLQTCSPGFSQIWGRFHGSAPLFPLCYFKSSKSFGVVDRAGPFPAMRIIHGSIRLTASDLSNHLACRHLTTLDLEVLRRQREPATWAAPDLKVIQELGQRFERDYLEHLRGLDAPGGERKLEVVDLSEIRDEARLLAETRALMERGADAIAQGALSYEQWFGKPDVLRRVETPSGKWPWSYEVVDTKLARETKATTILQLSLYSELLAHAQGSAPQFLWVVTPGNDFAGEKYRVEEYAAYYRYVKRRLLDAVSAEARESLVSENAVNRKAFSAASGSTQYALSFEASTRSTLGTYPEPVEHCNVCQWFRECDGQRRADDHLSLVAGIRRQQRDQFEAWNAETMAKLAALPIPLQERPRHGSKAGYEKVREQARVQVEGRTQNTLKYEPLPVVNGTGFCRLPEPSPGDMFVDLEGDPFANTPHSSGGQEYLFGFVAADKQGILKYEKRWTLTRAGEKAGFQWLIDEVMRRWKDFPAMHVYHFGGYEPGAFKRLMGRYATREEEVDSMLRAGLFVDLHSVLKQAVRAGVEEYSLKVLEALYGFARKIPKEESRAAMRFIEHRLELGWDGEALPEKYRDAMEVYNSEDCFSTAEMRDWLEKERTKRLQTGAQVPRPPVGDGSPPEEVDERQKRVAALVEQLKAGLREENRAQWTCKEQGRWLLANLLDWHRREDKAVWWEYYRLRDMKDEDLMEERSALAGLRHEGHLGMQKKSPVERYSFPKQETEIRRGDKLCHGEITVGTVESIDIGERTIEIKRSLKTANLHPTSVFIDGRGPKWELLASAIYELGQKATENRPAGSAAWDLLTKRSPRLRDGEVLCPIGAETTVETARRIGSALSSSVFAIQGPPGAGKTFTAARMISRLVREGKRLGITAHSHKAIGKLLQEVQVAADEDGIAIHCVRKISDEAQDDEIRNVEVTDDNAVPLDRLQSGRAQVGAGTAWMWARPEYADTLHALFIDEAGQMALADVVAAARAARNLVLVGDPQQLQRPLKGSHPDGAEKSALEHLIGERKTILPEMGMLLPETRRMHARVCQFTSELFYEGKLKSHSVTAPYRLEGHLQIRNPGLYFVPVEHDGNQNSCAEEVAVVDRVVKSLLQPQIQWFYGVGNYRTLRREEDILIVAPYNAQVSDLAERLPGMKIGTVDKFQGQEAPVVIYSMTTSSPEEAPRGMEFLYSLNRLNVATSRAMTAVILVGSPKLFEPECRTPRQMQLANALCAYREMATEIDPENI